MSRLARVSDQICLYLRVEGQKMRSLWGNPLPLLVVGAPLGFVLLKGLGILLRGGSLGADRQTYWYFLSMGQFFWDQLVLPLLTIAACSWLVWMDREQGHWKVLLSQPLTRTSYLLSKMFLILTSVLLVELIWWSSHWLVGAGLGLTGTEILPRAGLRALQVWVAMTPLIASQTWLAVRVSSPFSAFGIGLAANTAAMALPGTSSSVWHPWGLAHLALRSQPEGWQLSAALAGALLIVWGALHDFERRDLPA